MLAGSYVQISSGENGGLLGLEKANEILIEGV